MKKNQKKILPEKCKNCKERLKNTSKSYQKENKSFLDFDSRDDQFAWIV